MNEATKANSISVSLMNRKIYAVCSTELDTIAAFHDSLYQARRRFFEAEKSVHVRESGIYNGLTGKLKGNIKRHSCKWIKKIEKSKVESDFTAGKQRGIEYRQLDGSLRARIYFDRDLRWIRSDYFSPEDSASAKVSFKPDDTRDAVLRFDYNRSTGKTKETLLFPVPYAYQTAEQSLQNAQYGEKLFLVATDRGDFAYCPRDEQQKRIRFLKNNKNASVMLSMGWEIKDGDVTPPDLPADRNPEYIFSDIEETVRTEYPEDTSDTLNELFEDRTADEIESKPTEPVQAQPEMQSADADAENQESDALLNTLGITKEDAAHIFNVLDRIVQQPSAASSGVEAAPTSDLTLIRNGSETQYSGSLKDGLREGFGRTESTDGITLYEGEYKNDLRDGFGTHHYKSGAVSYIGDFKADKRDGFGVSFRENDHALHISHWVDGKPEGYATLFDKDGVMRFTGKIIDGKKQGAGLSVDPDKDTIFIAKYVDNEMTDEGALFSGDGTLLYVGGWKDGKRCGHGTEFDKNGDVVYAGDWKDDQYLNGILYKKVQGDT